MNKFIMSCKLEIESLVDRVRGKEITHIIVTTSGNKIKCVESIELFSDETKFIVAKCINKLRYKLVTIDDNNVAYILEKYDDNSWNQISNIVNVDNDGENVEDNRLYG